MLDENGHMWLSLSDFPNYEINEYGDVRNKRTGRISKPFPDRYGYLRVSIGNTDNVYIRRLMAETFYGKPKDRRMQVNHIDSDRQNNFFLNLEWVTPSRNIKWAIHHGNLNPYIGLAKAVERNRKPVRIVEFGKTFKSIVDCADFLGVEPTNVSRCLRGSRKGQRLKGYHIEYAKSEGLYESSNT